VERKKCCSSGSIQCVLEQKQRSIESQELDKLIICYYHSIDQRPYRFLGLIKVDLYTQLVKRQYLT